MRSPTLNGVGPTENTPLMAEMIPSPNQLDWGLPDSVPGSDSVSMEKHSHSPSGLLQNAEPDLTHSDKQENAFIESEKKANPLDSSGEKQEAQPKESKKEDLPTEQGFPFMESFLIELVESIKKALASIYNGTVLAMDKYDDVEIRRSSHTQVKDEIKKINSLLNNLLNFINVNTPIANPNTLRVILEEILKADEEQFRQKDIKIYKKYEENLPDTYIQPEQVRFILHAVLQYAILLTAPRQTIGFLMKLSDNGTGAEKTASENKPRYIEVIIAFNGYGNPVDPSESLTETPGDQTIGLADVILRLAKDILERNHGRMIEARRERSKTLIALRFPIERRKVAYYRPLAIK